MTIATLILTCTIFVALGWTGDCYAPVALCVGAVICIAAAQRRRHVAGPEDRLHRRRHADLPADRPVIGVVTSALVIGMTTLYLHSVMAIGSQRCRRRRRR
jgi:hypothetical protein